jgi:hypothetical protein
MAILVAMAKNELEDVLQRIVGVLEEVRVPYMIAGSVASNVHGVERDRSDLDVVIDPDPATLEALVDALPRSAYHGSAEAAREALRTRSTFTVVDFATATRIDFIMKKDRPFSHAEMERRVAVELAGRRVFVVSAEDTILSELEWSKLEGGSKDQLRNAAGIVASRGDKLDRAYVARWIDELGLAEEWAKALAMLSA